MRRQHELALEIMQTLGGLTAIGGSVAVGLNSLPLQRQSRCPFDCRTRSDALGHRRGAQRWTVAGVNTRLSQATAHMILLAMMEQFRPCLNFVPCKLLQVSDF